MLKDRILKVWKKYITSQFLVMMSVFGLTWLAGALTGLRFAFLNAMFSGVCELIPNFGPLISGAVSVILALAFGSSILDLANWQFALIILGICVVIQLLQNWLINPLVVGKTMDLNPILIFLGSLAFTAVFGFWGMVLAVPIMATFKEALKYSQEKKLQNSDQVEKLPKPKE